LDRFNEQEYQRVFATMERERVDGLFVSEEGQHITFMTTIVELAAKSRIPAIYPWGPDFIKAGGLMSYSLSYKEVWRRLASVVDQILKGANPGDIPVLPRSQI
jgi:putative ABC transport system substrate-binding protein